MPLDGRRWMKSKWLKLLGEFLLSSLFPPRCVICDSILDPEDKVGIHTKCINQLISVGTSVCFHCGRPIKGTFEYCYDCSKKDWNEGFSQGKALFVYDGAIRKSMYRLKYNNRREYAKYFAREAVRYYASWIRQNNIEAIVPVPMYGRKQRVRGYNQAETFAKALSDILQIPCDSQIVERIKDTTPQKELSDIARKNNLKTAFHSRQNIVKYNHILLVDDIYTTGSTADAVAAVLKASGVKEVFFLAVCIGKGI